MPDGQSGPLSVELAPQLVEVDGLRWTVRMGGTGPALLLLHGTGSAGASFRHLLPALTQEWRVVAPDLPGHGGTADPGWEGLSLPGMAWRLHRLCVALDCVPQVIIGHSAGAAIACAMALDGLVEPRRIIALNGALLPPLHMPLEFLSPLARVVAALPLVPRLVALRARDGAAVRRLLAGTGSQLDPAGEAFYTSLMASPRHVAAALRMMAAWNLAALARRLPALRVPLDLVVAGNDRTIPPGEAVRVQALLPAARILALPGLGHLAHEEDPVACLNLLLPQLRAVLQGDRS